MPACMITEQSILMLFCRADVTIVRGIQIVFLEHVASRTETAFFLNGISTLSSGTKKQLARLWVTRTIATELSANIVVCWIVFHAHYSDLPIKWLSNNPF